MSEEISAVQAKLSEKETELEKYKENLAKRMRQLVDGIMRVSNDLDVPIDGTKANFDGKVYENPIPKCPVCHEHFDDWYVIRFGIEKRLENN